MACHPTPISDEVNTLPGLPAWLTSGCAETPETVAFRSGAALSVLDALRADPRHGVPVELLANRLALTAATATSKLEGRQARETDIRDAYHLTPSGEARGPDGDLLAFWRRASRLTLTGRNWQSGVRALVGADFGGEMAGWLAAAMDRVRTHGPLAGGVRAMHSVLGMDDRAERTACLIFDIVLARALRWPTLLPVSARHLTKAMLRGPVGNGQRGGLGIQRCILASVEDTIRGARDLSVRARALRAIAPKLRARGSDAAVALFLSQDAVAPSSMLSPMIRGSTYPMTDRAARRLCDRLVDLGVARELTGRATFRLYGL